MWQELVASSEFYRMADLVVCYGIDSTSTKQYFAKMTSEKNINPTAKSQ